MTVKRFFYLISFGGNMGNREQNARDSLSLLEDFGQIRRQSRWILTQPMRSNEYATHDHDDYLNFVFEFESSLLPDELYQRISEIEDSFGHDRSQRWRPRAVDFDLLFFSTAGEKISGFDPKRSLTFFRTEKNLQVPHTDVWQRNFLLELIEIDLKIPIKLLQSVHNHSVDE